VAKATPVGGVAIGIIFYLLGWLQTIKVGKLPKGLPG